MREKHAATRISIFLLIGRDREEPFFPVKKPKPLRASRKANGGSVGVSGASQMARWKQVHSLVGCGPRGTGPLLRDAENVDSYVTRSSSNHLRPPCGPNEIKPFVGWAQRGAGRLVTPVLRSGF